MLAEAPGCIRRLSADKAYDAAWLRADLRAKGTAPVILGKLGRKKTVCRDKRRCRERWRIEPTFYRLEDFGRTAARYDKLVRNDDPALAPTAVIASWC